MMLHDTPLRPNHDAFVRALAARAGRVDRHAAQRPGAAIGQRLTAEIEYVPYGLGDEQAQPACEIVASFGEVELEYAAIRRGAGLFDSPHRGTLLVTGSANDRRDLFNRILTQELKDLIPEVGVVGGVAKSAFLLSRKGRIEADLFLIELGDRMLIDLDIHQAATAAKSLADFIFAEDVQITDASDRFHHIAVHGKFAAEAIAAARANAESFSAQGGGVFAARIGDVEVVIARRDQTGEPGFELIMEYAKAANVWAALAGTQITRSPDRPITKSGLSFSIRPIGWYAYNTARIEAGTPLFNIDFGPTNLPHETGILRERVSFTKGCYVGQELVARMENLGRPKQVLVGLRVQDGLLPVAGAQVFQRKDDGSMGDEIGVVTSSTLSPMLGGPQAPIAFAMIKTADAPIGALVLVSAEGALAPATVGPLRSWPPLALNRA